MCDEFRLWSQPVSTSSPSRSRGNRRLYSVEDIERLRRIKMLIDDLGLNLAGVEVIMRMGERMAEMERWLRLMDAELRRLP